MYLKVYRGSTTGWYGYIGCDADREVFRTGRSFFSPTPPVDIQVGNVHMESTYDADTTLIPGITCRRILNDRGQTCSLLRFDGNGMYSLRCWQGEYLIEDRNGRYLVFSRQNRCVLTMKRMDGSVPGWLRAENSHLDLDAYFEVMAEPELSPPLVAILASFPLLRFDHDCSRTQF